MWGWCSCKCPLIDREFYDFLYLKEDGAETQKFSDLQNVT